MSRYHRQSLLPQIGAPGQRRLAAARVLLVGCGALGTTIAEQLVRAGVGFLSIVDRDLVEITNLQRQVLFDEADIGSPKAVAAASRLARVNSEVTIEPIVADVHTGNIEELIGASGGNGAGWHGQAYSLAHAEHPAASTMGKGVPLPVPPDSSQSPSVDLLLDGTDNVETRYLINDVAIKHNIPWVYGACVGVEGRVMPVLPGQTACLRCVFPEPPSPGELATCDTAGVLGAAAAIVAAMQATVAIQILVGATPPNQLVRVDLWRGRYGATSLDDARRHDCPTCGQRRFDFLDAPAGNGSSTSLCGRNAVQVRPAVAGRMDLVMLEHRLTAIGRVQRTAHLLKCDLGSEPGVSLTVFPDGRAIVHGVNDPARARAVYAKWVGA
ncbi:ThiF family adenylyltransferase [Humisphaera borealis]|uniref:ThiF family adenylyltransferase n=1 Tax=Humisphaera borealis TaxID=2807512 RepID=A0A7M2WVN6_9BACT|nr:ThiF family adenylyltransferase [Humisphaera borealis]QOV89449.1 ThiF family adenylyltransferase [Humisphaera borealis]